MPAPRALLVGAAGTPQRPHAPALPARFVPHTEPGAVGNRTVQRVPPFERIERIRGAIALQPAQPPTMPGVERRRRAHHVVHLADRLRDRIMLAQYPSRSALGTT
ncbi:hypothetical protein [Burkholderia anthina]|uniref:hypothetical protein n=1 Tax=Burkholderia anthina TaxID=179879 RepID=UPI00158AFFB1|nr:hypothetical protein [Burkholderia anthina]